MIWIQDGPRMVLSAACPLAVAQGMRPGMKLAQAQAMHPALDVRQATPEADSTALSELADWCRRYTPLARAEPPDGIWLDLSGCAHLFGGETALLADLLARLRRTGLSARIAVAETAGAAYALAVHGPAPAIAAPAGGLDAMLAPLPVAALRLTPDAVALLYRFGLRRIGELACLPRGPLTRRLGTHTLLRLDQAFGRIAEPICPDLPAAIMQERLGFIEPVQTAESLAAANALLADRLCIRLQALCLGAKRLELVLVRVDGSVCVQTVALSLAANAPRHLARLLDERLEQIDPGLGIETIWLLARIAEPVAPQQDTLRGVMPDRSEPGSLAPLIDTLCVRLGTDRLWRPALVESDVPERSVGRLPPLSLEPGSWPPGLPRPIRLMAPPVPVRAMAVLPDQPPAWFIWRRQRHVVRRADGPERIAGEWWKHPGELVAIRDYFRIEDQQGRRFWLFRRGDGSNPQTGDLGWFLHGLF